MANSPANRRRRGKSIQVVDPKRAVDLATAQTYSENVFLFAPNLIGESCFATNIYLLTCFMLRVRAYYTGWSLATLYELSPEILHASLRGFVLVGCSGRTGCASIGSDVKIWCGLRYGYRSVSHSLSRFLPSDLCMHAAAQLHACSVTLHLHTRHLPSSFSSLLRSTLAVTTCICIGKWYRFSARAWPC